MLTIFDKALSILPFNGKKQSIGLLLSALGLLFPVIAPVLHPEVLSQIVLHTGEAITALGSLHKIVKDALGK